MITNAVFYLTELTRIRSIAVCILIGIASIGTGCASSNLPSIAQTLNETTGQNGQACVRTSDIRGYGIRNGNIINIDALHNYYIVTVLTGCIDLESSPALMFHSRFQEICGGGSDKIVVRGNTCSIDKIYVFEDREEAFSAFDEAVERREQLRQRTHHARQEHEKQRR